MKNLALPRSKWHITRKQDSFAGIMQKSLSILWSWFNSSLMLKSIYSCWAAVSAILDLIGLLATCLVDLLDQMAKKSLWTNAKSHFSLYWFINYCYKLGHSV